jgi:hypothetical protein
MVVTAFVRAVLGILVWWLETESPLTPPELDRFIARLLSQGIRQTLNLTHGVVAVHQLRA